MGLAAPVQDISGYGTDHLTLTLPGSTTAGNRLLISVGAFRYATTAITLSVSDNKGNTPDASHVSKTGTSTNRFSLEIFSIPIVTGGANHQVTVNGEAHDVTTVYLAMSVVEVSGIAATSPVDKTAIDGGSGTSASSGNIATDNADDFLYGSVYDYTNAADVTAGGDFAEINEVDHTDGETLQDQWDIVSATGTYASTQTLSASHSWYAAIVAFKAAAAAGGLSFQMALEIPAGMGRGTGRGTIRTYGMGD